MSMSIRRLQNLGQSLWYDNIQRGLLKSGELAGMIERGEIRGITSNPTIFDHAISKSKDYDDALLSMAWSGLSSEEIFDILAVEDIQAAADLFLPIYKQSNGDDGYVSLEVNPNLAKDSRSTIHEAKRLWNLVDRPNLMVKIPATKEGLPAITASIAKGININVTLIFSLKRYAEVMEAYLSGLKLCLESGLPIDRVASVASFFVSRVDSKVDQHLQEIISREGDEAAQAVSLLGKAAVANAKLAYDQFLQVFNGEDFAELKKHGARLQRPLWASTSTKNPAYSDVKYIEELIGANTVNTIPQITLDAFRDHGTAHLTLVEDLEEARGVIESLESLGISMDQVTQELEEEGVKAFADSYNTLLKTIEQRALFARRSLGKLVDIIPEKVSQFEADSNIQRIFEQDASLWTDDPEEQAEIRNRLGWLTLPETSRSMIPDLNEFANEIRDEEYTKAILLGMGGSSLASEVMSSMVSSGFLRRKEDGLDLIVLDSTVPSQVSEVTERTRGDKTLYIVSSKSGGTAEVIALFNYFWKEVESRSKESEDRSTIGKHFIAITDPGTSLESLARERKFRRVFLADPTVGGRNSALSAFSLVPGALLGVELDLLLDRSEWMAKQCRAGIKNQINDSIPVHRNPGVVLGTILGQAALEGMDKLTLISDEQLAPLCFWIEQLIAESTGKDGKGMLPVVDEPVVDPELYGSDRIFVYIRHIGTYDDWVEGLHKSGRTALTLDAPDGYDLGAEFYRWQIATAVGSAVIGVNSFNQPDVQDTKVRTGEKLKYLAEGLKAVPGQEILWEGESLQVYGTEGIELRECKTLKDVVSTFVGLSREGGYIALNAFLPRSPEYESLLKTLRVLLLDRSRLATTIGFGPRYLHSIGQLYKGGPDNGLFLFITADAKEDIAIPGQRITFGTLELAQALGDFEALAARGRPVLRIHLAETSKLNQVVEALH